MPCDECAVANQLLAEERAARRYGEEVLGARLARRDERIAALEAEVARYRALVVVSPEGE